MLTINNSRNMTKYWKDLINEDWIKKGITNEPKNGTIAWAERFGNYLAKEKEVAYEDKNCKIPKRKGKWNKERQILSTNQLRKFFGEVKRLQSFAEFNSSEFALLKPKLAYAVARAKDEDAKIHDFYHVLTNAIDIVSNKTEFKNFIKIFEAIVAYHKASEVSKLNIEN